MDEVNTKSTTDREQAILIAAEREFMEKGMAGARTTSIAAAAGLSHSMLRYYFRTKEALFERVCREKLNEMAAKVFALLLDTSIPIQERILLAVKRHFEFVKVNYRLPLMLLNEYRHDPANCDSWFGGVHVFLDSMKAKLNGEIHDAVANGVIAPIDMVTLFVDILALNLTSVAFAEPSALIAGVKVEEYLDNRLEENMLTIKKRIQP
ncbi:MAG: TetR/AcrR family transcriptional regulator [Bacteroidales bacterium]|nr:TetR/AcrR family transcriptional regulator [Bacteroidales bacterium]